MPDTYLVDMLKRVSAMEIEAVATAYGDTITAVRYWPFQQAQVPYFVNRLGAMAVSGGGVNAGKYSEDVDEYLHTILMRLVSAHLTEDYEGNSQDKLYDYIDAVEEYFREHPMLTTNAGTYTTKPSYLLYEARISGHTGLVAFAQGGVGQIELGCEFTLLVPYLRQVY